MLAWPLVWLQMVQQEMKQEEAAMLVWTIRYLTFIYPTKMGSGERRRVSSTAVTFS